jgi:cell division septation protein DedD
MTYTASVIIEGNYTDTQKADIVSRLESGIETSLTGSSKGHSWSMDATVTLVSSAADVPKENHKIIVTSTIPNASSKGTIGRVNDIGDNTTYINTKIVSKKPSDPGNASMERTAGHETGHIANLKHPKTGDGTPKDNLMHQTRKSGSMDLTSKQVDQIQDSVDNGHVNKGVSKPAPAVKSEATTTSDVEPEPEPEPTPEPEPEQESDPGS